MKTILITGGAGFIGYHLTKRLLAEGHRVHCLDNLTPGCNHKHFLDHPNYTFEEHDIVDPWPNVLNIEIGEIYNLACPASPPHYQADPIHTTETCVIGVRNMLDLAISHGARILQASTSEVYGDAERHPQKEDYTGNVNTVGPRSCYDEGKRCAESLVTDYHRVYGLDTKIARIFNTYGPYMNATDGRVVSNFIVQAITGDALTIYGSGQQTRSFCYVDDLVEGLIRLMNSSYHGPVNLGNPAEFTISELASKLAEKIPGLTVTYRSLPIDDPKQRCPDIRLVNALFDWKPTVSLDEGLNRTIEYFRENELV